MGKKGGGAPSTAGLEQATQQATELQKEIYDLTRQDVQPWYNMGTGAVSRLSDLLGISGGSVQSREQMYNELLPQYTSQITTTPASPNVLPRYLDPRGRITDVARDPDTLVPYELFQPAQETTTQDVIDYQGLNAALDERMGGQQTPEDYGALLRRYEGQDLYDDPGYQFRKQEAESALERQMAAQGITLGGAGKGQINPAAYRAMEELSQGLASQEYQNSYNRYVNDQLNTFNMLTGAAGMGQNATGQMAGAGQNYATNVGNLQTGLAQAQYQAALANANKPRMFSQLLGAGTMLGGAYLSGGGSLFAAPETWASGAAFASDKNVKENIEYVGMNNGHKMYQFNYKGDTRRFEGVMAQDVIEYMPEAVVDIDGILAVDYGRLGVEMKEV